MRQEYLFRIIPGITKVEYDSNDENDNRKNYHYSLRCAKDIFENYETYRKTLLTSGPFIENKEVRHMHLAEYYGKIVFIVTAMRLDEAIRVVSMRDAAPEERKMYQKHIGLSPLCQS